MLDDGAARDAGSNLDPLNPSVLATEINRLNQPDQSLPRSRKVGEAL
jgi:hypothetical protein